MTIDHMDMNDNESSDLVASTEKAVYGTFTTKLTVMQSGHVGRRIIPYTTLALPTNSVWHQPSYFSQPDVSTAVPVITSPPIVNEEWSVYIKSVLHLPQADDPQFPITDTAFRFQSSRLMTQIQTFFRSHRTPHIRMMINEEATLNRPNLLAVYDYAPLQKILMQGPMRMRSWRHFDILLRTMLRTAASCDHRYHYLHFPLSTHLYTQTQFTRAFTTIAPETIKIRDDPSYFVLLHLLGFLTKLETSTSLFSLLNEDQQALINLVLTCGDHAIIYNLARLKSFVRSPNYYLQVLKHIAALKILALDDADLAIVDVASLTDDDFNKLINGRARADNVDVTDDVPLPPVAETSTVVAPTPSAPAVSTPAPVPASLPTVEPTKPLAKEVVEKTVAAVMNHPQATQDQRDRVLSHLERYDQITVGGVSLTTHMQNDAVPAVDSHSHLEHLEGHMADASMLQSSIAHYDKQYTGKLLHGDVARVLTSMSPHGMVITKVEERKEISQLNRIHHFTVGYVDATGKNHSIRFKLPIVAPDGTMMVNGITSRMTHQMINTPICKVSPRRVSLASNFNKTLVERSEYQVNRFDVTLSRLVTKLVKAGAAHVEYGKPTTDVKIPYDLACLGSYATVSIGNLTLIGDYKNRHAIYSKSLTSAAREADTGGEQVETGNAEEPRGRFLVESEILARGWEADKSQLFPNGSYFIGWIRTSGQVDRLVLMDADNRVHVVSGESVSDGEERPITTTTLLDLIASVVPDGVDVGPVRVPAEWTQLQLQNRSFPIVFVLGFQYGLTATLDHAQIQRTFIPKEGQARRPSISRTDIIIEFADGWLVTNRYPLEKSLIAAGLARLPLTSINYTEMEEKDAYYRILVDMGISTNVLKGVASFFALFVDPLTRSVLEMMKEPTTVRGLLLRATQMLADTHSLPSSAAANLMMRGYDRMPAALYTHLAMAMASYNASKSARKTFSLNPEAVFLGIMTDPTVAVVEEINPVHDVKSKTAITFAGSGGRTQRSFMINDRQFPQDGVGIFSECTPDNGKVGLNAYLTANPRLVNLRGMLAPVDKPDETNTTPTMALSVPGLLMPGTTNDDGKRASFIGVQMSHHVPSEHSDVNRLVTGMEKVLAHMVGSTFACVADRDGVVESINSKLGLVTIRYAGHPIQTTSNVDLAAVLKGNVIRQAIARKQSLVFIVGASLAENYTLGTIMPGDASHHFKVVEALQFATLEQIPNRAGLPIHRARGPEAYFVRVTVEPIAAVSEGECDVFQFGVRYTPVSGSYVKQNIVLNVEQGEAVKKGDVVAYNSGFFKTIPGPPGAARFKQVAWKHGVMGTVAFIERSQTHEDSCSIDPDFGKRLETTPAHPRVLTLTNQTVIHSMVKPGDHVQTIDPLCQIEDAALDVLTVSDDPETVQFLSDLNRLVPKARYHGVIASIEMYYACDISEMHPSLASLARTLAQHKQAIAEAAAGSRQEMHFPPPGKLSVGTKFRGVEFARDTVVIVFIIAEEIPCRTGDKIVVMSANKSIIGETMVRPTFTKSGRRVDVIFAGDSIQRRIVDSPLINGIVNVSVEKLEQDIINM